MPFISENALERLVRTVRSVANPPPVEPQDDVQKAVWQASRPSLVYWLMNGLATVIACYGLFDDSASGVIGAMVVAMLMGPISGIALGLNEGDRRLLRTALFSLIGGAVWVLAIGITVGLFHRDVPLTGEILSRTDPRIFDLMIALAGGAAGAIAVVSPGVGTAIVGVAVATALVPPTACAGILLARGDVDLAMGALLLVLTNIIAIQLAFSVVFWVAGYRYRDTVRKPDLPLFARVHVFGLVLICLLVGGFAVQLHRAVSRSLFESGVRAVLTQHFDTMPGYHLVDFRLDREAGATAISAVVRGPIVPSAEEVASAQSDLPSPPDGSTPTLRVRFIEVVIMTPQGRILGGDEANHRR